MKRERSIRSNRKQRTRSLGRVFSLLLVIGLVMGHLPGHQVLAYPEVTPDVIDDSHESDLSESQVQALAEIGLERRNRGLVGFEGSYALSEDSSPVNVIVLFEHSPAEIQVLEAIMEGDQLSEQAARAVVEDDHTLFRQELSALFGRERLASYTINWEYREALNGVSLTIPANLVAAVANFDSVRVIYPDAIITMDSVNVSELAEAIDRNPPGMAPGRRTMRADDMHALGYRGAGVVIAVIDTGIDYYHPAFAGSFLTLAEMQQRNPNITAADTINGYFYGRNFVTDDALRTLMAWTGRPVTNIDQNARANDPMEFTRDFWQVSNQPWVNPANNNMFITAHGTHVAGTIAGRDSGAESGAELAALGVAPEASIFAYRVLGPYGSGLTSSVAASIEKTVYDRPDIVNLSLGGGVGTGPTGWLTSVALNNVKLAHPDITFVVSAGNSGSNYHTVGAPGIASTAITVSNIAEAGYTAGVLEHGGVRFNLGLGAPPLGSPETGMWINDPELGLARNIWGALEHDNGVFRIIPLPRLNQTNAVPGPVPGVGTAEEFAALAEMYDPEELAGAFVLVRRGYTFVSVANAAHELGIGGVIAINNTDNHADSTASMPLPYMFIGLNDGVRLYNNMEGNPSTLTIPQVVHSPFRLASSSSRGPIPQSFEIKPDIGANGTNVLSTVPVWWVGATAAVENSGGGDCYLVAYGRMSGTSMSAPHVAGGAALMLEFSRSHAENQWTNEELKARMMNTAIPFEDGFYSVFDKGSGYMDVYAAAHADTMVSVIYDRVTVEYGIPFNMQTRFYQTRTGSFSFGYFNNAGRTGLNRSLTATIANQSNAVRTYYITYEFNMGVRGVPTPNPRNYATLSFDQTAITVPAGSEVDFVANLQIAPNAPVTTAGTHQRGFYEGHVFVRDGAGNLVARLPFAGVAIHDPDAVQDEPLITRLAIANFEGVIDQAAATIRFQVPNHLLVDGRLHGPITQLEAECDTVYFWVAGVEWPRRLGEVAGFGTGDLVYVAGGQIYTLIVEAPDENRLINHLRIGSVSGVINQGAATITFTVPRHLMLGGDEFRGVITQLDADCDTVIFFVGGDEWPRALGEIAGINDGDLVYVAGGRVYTIRIVIR